jgi:prepilin-type N-terminal cleavage/methylation domain-containing protein
MNRRFEDRVVSGRILPFPRRHDGGRKRSARAFTLLELMVVVAVMGIVLAMGIPAIRSATHRDPLAQGVVDILDACQGTMEHPGARSLAILRGEKMELRIFPQEKRIEVGEASSSAAPAAAAANPGEPPADAALPKRAALGFSAKLSDRLNFKMLDVNFIDCRDADEATVWFYPNGTSDELNIVLLSDDGEARRITLDTVTGLPQVLNFP